ncbi:aldo/keto reductase [Amycolatopsis nigrescens]|uniref:aldo/keto reductase n=1 Tax=Amycolatopsis nigrescens TaxID=381445 RepID=UPI00037E7ED2|nr:aldo/keto reductase [Amycolatopsis nigrescens]
MQYRPLGRTGLQTSVVSFGAAPLGDMFGPVDDAAGIATVRRALDLGINFFDTSPYYGNGLSEQRLGKALAGRRGEVLIGTKSGRFGDQDFDYRPARIRESLETSLRLLRTDYVDIFQLHDIEFTKLDPVFEDTHAELVQLRAEGKCRFIGMTGYPMQTLRRAVAETELDTVLSYAHYTLLNTRLATELRPLCEQRGTAPINAAAVAVGLLTPAGTRLPNHPAGPAVTAAASRVARYCGERGLDVAFLANQFAIQRSGCPTTVVGTTKTDHLESAVRAASTPLDEPLLAEVLALTADVRDRSWTSGLPENNG